MPNISTYPVITPKQSDLLIGSETYDPSDPNPVVGNPTRNFTVGSIIGLPTDSIVTFKGIQVNNLPPNASPTYDTYRPSTYITYPAQQAQVHGSVGIGAWALQNEVYNADWWTRGSNVAVGAGSGKEVTTGVGNVYAGFVSGHAATTGNFNSGIGNGALTALTTGGSNVAVGALSGGHLTTSTSTVNVGYSAGYENSGGSDRTTGSSSIFVGAFTKASANGTTNENVFGHSAVGSGSNTVRLGNSSVTKVTTSGDVETDTVGKGFVLKSPNGSRYRISVSNAGVLSATAL